MSEHPLSAPLELCGLGHSYVPRKAPPVFAGVDLEVSAGELLAVLGASGSGKTTLLRSVAGFVTPSQGIIRVQGKDVSRDGRELIPAERRRVGMVFQDYALFEHMTVTENIAFGLHRSPRDHIERRVQSLLELIELPELGKRRPSQLSGGQQQRVALARALAPGPSLLLLDEPFANLDAALRRELAEGVRDILREEGVSALLVTHDRSEALGLADRVAVLGGEGATAGLLQCAPPEEVYRQPATAQVATLTGDAIFIDGQASGQVAQTALGAIKLGRQAQGAVSILVRPEQLRFAPNPEGQSTVHARRFQGARYDLSLQTPAGPMPMEFAGVQAPERGARGDVTLEGLGWPLSV